MAIINLDVEKILSISNELNSLDTTLLNSYVPEIKDIINQIKSNVLNEQVNSILGTISSQVDSISGELAVDLPKLEQFLETQMQSYQTTEADAQAKLQAVVNMMGGFAGVQPTNVDSGNSADERIAALERENEQMRKELAEANKNSFQKANDEFLREAGNDNSEFADRFKSDWTNVGEAYQDGLLSGVVSTLGATWNTGANSIGWGWNQVVNCAEWGLGAIGLNDLANAAAWLIS